MEQACKVRSIASPLAKKEKYPYCWLSHIPFKYIFHEVLPLLSSLDVFVPSIMKLLVSQPFVISLTWRLYLFCLSFFVIKSVSYRHPNVDVWYAQPAETSKLYKKLQSFLPLFAPVSNDPSFSFDIVLPYMRMLPLIANNMFGFSHQYNQQCQCRRSFRDSVWGASSEKIWHVPNLRTVLPRTTGQTDEHPRKHKPQFRSMYHPQLQEKGYISSR